MNERAEGNPLFIEQLTYAHARCRSHSRRERARARRRATTGLESSIIPDTVQHVITSRLDQLPPGEAMTLKVASVIGPRFSVRTSQRSIRCRPDERSCLITSTP